ncbi:hypothetical protein ETC04_03330 [Geobacillus sp. MR]|uniref:hypothetical protein n=1 Tax=Geobacillus sp. MR TaxID=2508875 RepID=UPI00148E0C55|nr:hypothetical protein [Geobacillus sp. MR]NNU86207.1 hypothetical protein [Geobacillus sp. MR]
MEIRNIFMKQAMIASDQPVVLQKGETYDAVIKEKKGSEAIVHLKGTDVRVRAEGEWPREGRVTIKIVAEQDGVPVARIVSRPQPEANEQVTRSSASEPLTTELRQVGAWLQKQGQSLTKETVSTLQTFFTEALGTVEQKLETVRAVINKKLELTGTHLVAIHEALHGKPLGEQLAEIANNLDPSFTLTKREEQGAAKETTQNLTVGLERQGSRTEKASINGAADLLRQVREQITREPNLSKAVEYVRQQVVHAPNADRNVAEQVDRALHEVVQLQRQGRESEARMRLNEALVKAEQAVRALKATVRSVSDVFVRQLTPIESIAATDKGRSSVVQPTSSVHTGDGVRHAVSLVNSQNEVTDGATNDGRPIEQLREAIRRAIKSLQQEPHLEKVLDAVKGDIVEAFRAHPHWEQAWADSLASARKLMEKGRELAARQTVLKTLNEIETSIPSTSTERSLDVDSLFDGAWQASLSLESKQFLVQTVTKKMAQAALDFKNVKRDAMRQLETVAQLTENKSPATRLQATSMLEMAIKQLDNAILKSDIMLFTDMATEKQLMKASSALAEAKKRLRQGDPVGARNIVNEVKNMLANLVFKPSEAKVKHFVMMQGETTADSSKVFLEQMNQVMQPPADGPSARHVFDTIRRLGLTHEYEAAEWLVFKGNQEESASQNMKEVLLRLAQSGNESVARQAEQALTNLTGQQLLNKWDGTAGWQSFFFTLPLLWRNEVQNVNVYVNGRQHGEQIDWENCQLYFLLETRKLGDLGILLHANERNLSITLRNDRDDFAEKAKPFIDMAKEKLEEIGYRVTAVNVTKLANEVQRKDEQPSPASSTRPYRRFAERGYDVTI